LRQKKMFFSRKWRNVRKKVFAAENKILRMPMLGGGGGEVS